MSFSLLGLLKGGLVEIQRCTYCRELTGSTSQSCVLSTAYHANNSWCSASCANVVRTCVLLLQATKTQTLQTITSLNVDLLRVGVDWASAHLFLQRDGAYILENVSPDGKELPGSAGRLTVPGSYMYFSISHSSKGESTPKCGVVARRVVGPQHLATFFGGLGRSQGPQGDSLSQACVLSPRGGSSTKRK